MQDFTLTIYRKLLQELLTNGYSFQTLLDFIQRPEDKAVVLRHDVDRKSENALVIATIEKNADIRASYYFRIVKESYDEDIIRQIAKMGHEIGYHYENLSAVNSRKDFREVKGAMSKEKLFELAIEDFERNLEKFRKIYPVRTICMHGSPLSKWDNRDLWKRYNYKDYGIIAEPYFDLDFDKVFYLTDTGRRWDGDSVSVRDKVKNTGDRGQGAGVRNLRLRKTWDIIEAVEKELLPDKIMLNTHPQRWTDNPIEWTKELVWQNIKNVVKRVIVRRGKLVKM